MENLTENVEMVQEDGMSRGGKLTTAIVVLGVAMLLGFVIFAGYNYSKAMPLIDGLYAQIERPLTVTNAQIDEANDIFRAAEPFLSLNADAKQKISEINHAVSQARWLSINHGYGDVVYMDGKYQADGVWVDDNGLFGDGNGPSILSPTPVAPLATSAETGEPISSKPNGYWDGPVD